MQIKKPILLFG